jgi:hypothetical protein
MSDNDTTITTESVPETSTLTDPANSSSVVGEYDYCRCYGTFVAEVDQPEIDALMAAAQEIHRHTDAILPEDDCPCPLHTGELNQCSDCGGAFLIKDDEDEDDEEFRGSPIDFLHVLEDCPIGGCAYCEEDDVVTGEETPKKTVPIFYDEENDED